MAASQGRMERDAREKTPEIMMIRGGTWDGSAISPGPERHGLWSNADLQEARQGLKTHSPRLPRGQSRGFFICAASLAFCAPVMATLRLRLSAVTGFSAVLLGAMGAHGPVHERLKAAGELEHWQTALDYHLPHAVLLVVLSLWAREGGRAAAWAWRLVFAGVLLFSGSLYALALTQAGKLGAVTPLGGLALMLGWLSLLAARGQKAGS